MAKNNLKKGLPAEALAKAGFTLMELLIVVAIIGILVSIAAAAYTTAQKKSRDSRSISDMKAIQSAWELYFTDNNGTYPTDCTYSLAPTAGVMSGSYLPGGFPVDPKTGIQYGSTSNLAKCTSSSYCFCASMEYTSSGNSQKDCDGLTIPLGTSIYCVNQLQ